MIRETPGHDPRGGRGRSGGPGPSERRTLRLPPPEITRDEPPRDDVLLVVRGGANTLSDAALERATGDTWEKFSFFGVSVFAAPDDDLVALSQRRPQLRRRREVRVARCADLRAAGFDVVATFANPDHYSVVLAEVGPAAFARLRDVFSGPVLNPGYQPDR
jgi:hypothetical protein